MTRHKFKSIRENGGLKVHLDNTKSSHRGFGHKTYRILKIAGVNKANRARAFNVTSATIREWDNIDDRERLDSIKGNI